MVYQSPTFFERHQDILVRLKDTSVESFLSFDKKKTHYFVYDQKSEWARKHNIGDCATIPVIECPQEMTEHELFFAWGLADGPERWLTLGDVFAIKNNPIEVVEDSNGKWFEAGGRRLIPADDATHWFSALHSIREHGCLWRLDIQITDGPYSFYCLSRKEDTIDDVIDMMSSHDWGDPPKEVFENIRDKEKTSYVAVTSKEQLGEDLYLPFYLYPFEYLTNWVDLYPDTLAELFSGKDIKWNDDKTAIIIV